MSNIFFEKKHDCVVKSRDLVDYYGKLCIFADKYKANMNIESNMKEVCNYLHTIERTRLLRNTLKELELLVGFSVSNGNGLTRKGGKSLFVKDAIFRELAHIANKETGLNLQDVIDTYIETDRMLDRLGKIKDAPQTCKHLIWYFYENGEATEDIANSFDLIGGFIADYEFRGAENYKSQFLGVDPDSPEAKAGGVPKSYDSEYVSSEMETYSISDEFEEPVTERQDVEEYIPNLDEWTDGNE